MIFNIIIGGVVGILAALFFYILGKKFKISNSFATITTIVLIFAALNLSKMYLFPYYEAWKFESELKKVQFFSLIEKTNPKEYRIFLTKSKNAILSSKDDTQLQKYSAELISKIFPKYLSVSPNEQIHHFLQSLIHLYEYLYHVDPSIVVNIELGKTTNYSEINNKEFAKYLTQLLKAKEEIIKHAIKNPSPTPTENEAITHLEPIIAKLVDQYGETRVSYFISGNYKKLSDKELASIIISFYRKIYSSGKNSSGIIIRYISHEIYISKSENR